MVRDPALSRTNVILVLPKCLLTWGYVRFDAAAFCLVSRARAVSGMSSWRWRRMSSYRSDIRRAEPSRPVGSCPGRCSLPTTRPSDACGAGLGGLPVQRPVDRGPADAEDVADLADGELLLVVQPSGGLDLVAGQPGRAAPTSATSPGRCQTRVGAFLGQFPFDYLDRSGSARVASGAADEGQPGGFAER